jgi:hypothetical protein
MSHPFNVFFLYFITLNILGENIAQLLNVYFPHPTVAISQVQIFPTRFCDVPNKMEHQVQQETTYFVGYDGRILA